MDMKIVMYIALEDESDGAEAEEMALRIR